MIDPELVQAASLLNAYPSDTLILLMPYCNLLPRESLIAPVSTSCSRISPDVDDDAISYSLLIHPIEVTAPVCPFNLRIAYFYLLAFMSHILTVLFTDPAAMYLDLGENRQQLMEDGSSCPLWYTNYSSLSVHLIALCNAILPSCPQLAITLPIVDVHILVWL